MAEIAGLTLGVISLAGLFGTCIDAFSYVRAGQFLERDLEILLVKLDIEKARLLSWGNEIGIVPGVNDDRNTILNNQATEKTIRSILEEIKLLLTSSQKLQGTYALRELSGDSQTINTRRIDFVSRTSLSIFRRSYNRLYRRVAQDRPQVSTTKRVFWAIRDRERFAELVKDLREMVDGLVELMPATLRSAADRTIEDDVAGLRLANLRLVEEAVRDQERYQALSDTVSEAIQTTELGTIDRWLEDGSQSEAAEPESSPATAPEIAQLLLYIDSSRKFFMMLTSQCTNVENSELPCVNPENMPNYFSTKSMLARCVKSWHPGRRIGSYISLEDVTGFGRDDIGQLRLGLQRRSLQIVESESNASFSDYPPYIATIFIYCPPCNCLIDTAVEVCNNMPDPQLLRRLIRIDDRLPSSCLDQSTALEALRLIMKQIYQVERDRRMNDPYLLLSRAEYVDRDFIEDRILALEEEQATPLPATPEENVRRIFANHGYSDNVAGFMVLGEHRSLSDLMELPVLPKEPRMPRENELYVFGSGGKNLTRSRACIFQPRTKRK